MIASKLTYDPNKVYKIPKNRTVKNQFIFVNEVYAMFQEELDKRDIDVIATDHLWKDLQQIIKEWDETHSF